MTLENRRWAGFGIVIAGDFDGLAWYRYIRFQQTPVDQGIVDEGLIASKRSGNRELMPDETEVCLKDGHQAVFLLPEDSHNQLARRAEVPFDPRHLHGVDQHPRQSKRDLLRKLTQRTNVSGPIVERPVSLDRMAVPSPGSWQLRNSHRNRCG